MYRIYERGPGDWRGRGLLDTDVHSIIEARKIVRTLADQAEDGTYFVIRYGRPGWGGDPDISKEAYIVKNGLAHRTKIRSWGPTLEDDVEMCERIKELYPHLEEFPAFLLRSTSKGRKVQKEVYKKSREAWLEERRKDLERLDELKREVEEELESRREDRRSKEKQVKRRLALFREGDPERISEEFSDLGEALEFYDRYKGKLGLEDEEELEEED